MCCILLRQYNPGRTAKHSVFFPSLVYVTVSFPSSLLYPYHSSIAFMGQVNHVYSMQVKSSQSSVIKSGCTTVSAFLLKDSLTFLNKEDMEKGKDRIQSVRDDIQRNGSGESKFISGLLETYAIIQVMLLIDCFFHLG